MIPGPIQAAAEGKLLPDNKPEYGSKVVSDKVSAFSKKPEVTVDLFTGKKVCHKFTIPAHYLAPVVDTLGKPKVSLSGAQELGLHLQMGYTQCIGDKCALWNAAAKECLDVTALKAQIKTGEAAEMFELRANASVPHGS